MKHTYFYLLFFSFLPFFSFSMEHNSSSDVLVPISPIDSSRVFDPALESIFVATHILSCILRGIVTEDELPHEREQSLIDMTNKIEFFKQSNQDDYKKMLSSIRTEFKIKKKLGVLNQHLSLTSKIREFGLVLYAQLLYKRIEQLQLELLMSRVKQKYDDVNLGSCISNKIAYIGGGLLVFSLLANIGMVIRLLIIAS